MKKMYFKKDIGGKKACTKIIIWETKGHEKVRSMAHYLMRFGLVYLKQQSRTVNIIQFIVVL